MKVWVACLLLALLVGCANAPSEKAATGKLVVRSADGTITITEGSYHCTGDGHANPRGFPNCKSGVPVIVMLKDDGSCLSLVPYYQLVVHPARFGDTEVTWRLFGPDRYEFDTGDGISLKRTPSGNPPTNNYRGKMRRNATTFKVDLIVGAPPDTFQHEALVRDPAGRPCTPIDPLIRNEN